VSGPTHIRTPLGRVRGRGSARSGTVAFLSQRLTAIANIPLTVAAIVVLIMLLGRNQAAVAQILGSPAVAIIMILFMISITMHMRIGMQVIIEDYVHDEMVKLGLIIANTLFCTGILFTAIFAILKLAFGL
jgi:succinate dehydrogenase / fumarate reductase, membrane anchor subunit